MSGDSSEVQAIHLMSLPSPASNGLPEIHRYITDHDSTNQAVFSDDVEEPVPWKSFPTGSRVALAYSTSTFPVNLADGHDLAAYRGELGSASSPADSNAAIVRIVDMKPEAAAPMHKTQTVDYGVVLEGEVEASLGSGQVRVLKRGDIIVQRATDHAWRNPSKTEWARILFFVLPAASKQ